MVALELRKCLADLLERPPVRNDWSEELRVIAQNAGCSIGFVVRAPHVVKRQLFAAPDVKFNGHTDLGGNGSDHDSARVTSHPNALVDTVVFPTTID